MSTEDGLSDPWANALFQDSQGFIWVSTENGIDRYDGYRFENISSTAKEPSNPSEFQAIYEMEDEQFWFGSVTAGILIYDGNHQLVDQYKYDENNASSLSHDWVVYFHKDRAGRIWVATYGGGLNQFHPETASFTRYVHDPQDSTSISSNKIYTLSEDSKGNLWMGTEDAGLNCFDPNTGLFKRYLPNPNQANSLRGRSIYDVAVDLDDNIWLADYGNGISFLNSTTDVFTHYFSDENNPRAFPSQRPYQFVVDKRDGIWIGMQDKGLSYLDFKSNLFTNYKHDPNRPTSLSSDRVLDLMLDVEGNLWIASGNGVNLFNRDVNRIINYQHKPTNINSLASQNLSRMFEDSQGQIWFGTSGSGISILNSTRDKFRHIKSDPNNPKSLSDDFITDFYENRKGQVVIGTRYGGLNIYDPVTKTFRRISTNSDHSKGLLNSWVFEVAQDEKGRYWIASPAGMTVANPELTRFEHMSSRENSDYFIDSEFLWNTIPDMEGFIWTYDPIKFQWFKINPDTKESTSPNIRGSRMFQKDKNGMWINDQDGLIYFQFTSEEIQKYDHTDGLPENIPINGLTKDINGLYWLSTAKGIYKWNQTDKTSVTYSRSDGLLSNAYMISGFSSKSDNKLYFMSSDGVSSFNPAELKPNPTIPPIAISKMSYYSSLSDDNAAVRIPGISSLDQVTFPYHYNILDLEFTALSFSKSDKNQYAYKIEGLSEIWIELGTKRKLTLTNLDPKTYTLRIRGSNGDGIWNNEGTALKIKITPPWWASWWAYITYLLIIVGSILYYIRWRTQADKLRLTEKQRVVDRLIQVDKIKDQFLANTSHELRTPLNGIIGLSESLIDGAAGPLDSQVSRNLDMIATSGRRLSNLVNDILDFSKLKNKALDLKIQPIDIHAAVEVVLTLSTPEINLKKLIVRNNIPKDFTLVDADENRVQQILFNLIGNAIKFTETGTIDISTKIIEDLVQVTIEDTGIGIAANKIDLVFNSFEQGDGETARIYGGTGLGLSITKLLVEQHGGTISLQSEINKGTIVTFTLPPSVVDRSEFIPADRKEPTISGIMSLETGTEVLKDRRSSSEDDSFKGRILVVDDEAVNRQVLENHLKVDNYKVVSAVDGPSALEIIKENEKFDLILLDVMMPRMTGYEVAKEIRKTFLPNDLPIIMLTAKNRIQDLITGFESGANDYLTKPFSKGELLIRTETHIELSKIHSATSKFVPDEFIRTVGRNKITDVELGDYAEKIVTVLFTDIRDYTAIAEKMSPHDNFEFVRSYVSRMGPIIEKNHGFINQYLGDGIMAIFAHRPSDALDAAIEMQHEIQAYNEHRHKAGRSPIIVGMGMMTGPLVMGIIGDEHRKDTTSISDTVNVAARLEGLTKTYKASIILSNKTLDNLDPDHNYQFRNLGLSSVKGKSELIDVYECFSGDSIKLLERKSATSTTYEKAIRFYMNEDFESAKKLFQEIFNSNSDDRVVNYFLGECTAQLSKSMVQKT